MLAGYLTFDELRILTGYTKTELDLLIRKGLRYKNLSTRLRSVYTPASLFDVREVEDWIRMHIL